MSGKITQVHVYIFGAVVMILIGVGMYFAMLKPLNDGNVALNGQVTSLEQQTVQIDGSGFNWEQFDQAEAKLAAAKERRAGKERRLASLEASKKLPRANEIDLGDGTDQTILQRTMGRWLQLPRVVVPMMENFAQARGRRRGVKITTAFTAPAPSTRPSDIPRDIIAWRLGTLTVEGRFERVMQWAKDWNSAPLLVSVEDLKCVVAGDNGEVQATASLVVYMFPTGKAVTNPGAGAAAPGGMPGMPGMMPGMPGGMPGEPGAPAAPGAVSGPGAVMSPAPPGNGL